MCAAQSNQQQTTSFGYTWGFADNGRNDGVVELSPNINYTVGEAVSNCSNQTLVKWRCSSTRCEIKTREAKEEKPHLFTFFVVLVCQ